MTENYRGIVYRLRRVGLWFIFCCLRFKPDHAYMDCSCRIRKEHGTKLVHECIDERQRFMFRNPANPREPGRPDPSGKPFAGLIHPVFLYEIYPDRCHTCTCDQGQVLSDTKKTIPKRKTRKISSPRFVFDQRINNFKHLCTFPLPPIWTSILPPGTRARPMPASTGR